MKGRQTLSLEDQDEEHQSLVPEPLYAPQHRQKQWPTICLAVAFSLSLLTNFALLMSMNARSDLDSICALHTSQARSPLTDAVKVKYTSRRFDGTFLNATPYFDDPSPEVDERWLALGTLGSSTSNPYVAHIQPAATASPSTSPPTYGVDPGYAKFRPSDGGGRRTGTTATTPRGGGGPFSNPEGILRRHVDHCLDILRQAVMCQPDTGVFGQYWVAATNGSGSWSGEDLGERPFVDFHTTHRCKNFEELRDWVVGHQISAEFKATAKLERRPGDRLLPGIP
ncbi:hypothetical protein PG984_005306 [Apiospora sp. TS-2023a]